MKKKIVSLIDIKKLKNRQEKPLKTRLSEQTLMLLSEAFVSTRASLATSVHVLAALKEFNMTEFNLYKIFCSDTLPLLIDATGLKYKFSAILKAIDAVYYSSHLAVAVDIVNENYTPMGITLVAEVNSGYRCVGGECTYSKYKVQKVSSSASEQKLCNSIITNLFNFAEENGWYIQLFESKTYYRLHMNHNKATYIHSDVYAICISLTLDKQKYKIVPDIVPDIDAWLQSCFK